MMTPVREAEKKYCSRALTVAIFAAFCFVLAGQKHIAKGLILGTFFSILNFILIGESLVYRIHKSAKIAGFRAFGSILVRYALLAVPVFLAIKNSETYNLIAVIAGMFSVQVVVLADHIVLSTQRG